MDSTFDAAEFVKDIGVLLVHAYDGARKATTPGLVGSAIEKPVRRLLSKRVAERPVRGNGLCGGQLR